MDRPAVIFHISIAFSLPCHCWWYEYIMWENKCLLSSLSCDIHICMFAYTCNLIPVSHSCQYTSTFIYVCILKNIMRVQCVHQGDVLCLYTHNIHRIILGSTDRLHSGNTRPSRGGSTAMVALLIRPYLSIMFSPSLFLSLLSSLCLSLFPALLSPFISDQIIFPTHISNQLFPQWPWVLVL